MTATWSIWMVRWSLAVVVMGCAVTWVAACGDKDKEKKKQPKQVRISVVVILASEKGDKIDKKLEGIAKEVQKSYPKLTNFELAKLSCKSLEVGKLDQFDLIEDQTMDATILKAADKMDRVCLKVAPPGMGELTYATPCGKFLPIMTEYRTKKNQLLLIAVRVQPCNGDK